jgi:hypothetical protein
LLNLHSIIDDQVHELIKALLQLAVVIEQILVFADPDLALNSDGELLVQPDTDCSVL